MFFGKTTDLQKTIRKKFIFHSKKKLAPRYWVNEQIRAPKVSLIDDAGSKLGEVPISEALAMAKQKQLDLVEVAPNVSPPVCKIMDYGKFQYQQSKQKRIAQAKQKKVEIKGVRIRVQTEDHDRQFKQSQIEKFLKKGDKVKIEIVLKGREKAHADLARTNLQEFLKSIATPYKIEEDIKRFPGGFNVLIAPK